MNGVLWGLLGYIVVQLLVGVWVSRRIRSEEDYYLAGRRFGPGLATFTVFATWFGAETCIGAAGLVYDEGLSAIARDPLGYTICLVLMGAVFAAPIWRQKVTTLTDLFRRRYGRGVEVLGVLLLAPASILWAAAQIRAFGQVIAASSDWGVMIGIAVGAGVVILYTVTGGMLADAVTDVLQGIAIIVGLVALLMVIFWQTEAASLLATVSAKRLALVAEGRPFLGTLEIWAIPIFGSVISQELAARMMASRSPQVARRASFSAAAMYLAVGLIPVLIGLIGPALMPGLKDHEQFLPRLARLYLSPVFYVLFAGALLSAILSTVDSALLAASALVSHNLVLPLLPGLAERKKVVLARAGVVVFGAVATIIALVSQGTYALVEQASAFGSSGVFVVIVFALFGRIGGRFAAALALAAGALVWGLGDMWGGLDYPYLSSLLAALLVYLFGALLERRFLMGGRE